jgi:hypothetical protein
MQAKAKLKNSVGKILNVSTLQEEDEEYESQFFINRVDEQYKIFGWVVFTVLLLGFFAGAITLIVLKFEARKAPVVALDVQKLTKFGFPSQLIVCPDTNQQVEWHNFELFYLHNARYLEKNHLDANLFYSKKAELDCINISLANIQTTDVPASLEISLVCSQVVDSYSDV